jgi:hypothetical protein
MSLNYCWEKFFAGTLIFAQSTARPPVRLAIAFQQIGRLKADHDMPTPELQERFEKLYQAMTSRGSFEDSAAAMDELAVHRAIGEVVEIYDCLAREFGLHDYKSEENRRGEPERKS